jgi:hypothetical protein
MNRHTLLAQANFGTGLQPNSAITGGLADIDTTAPLTATETLISNILGTLTTLGALVFIFMFFYGAFRWITGGDDAGKIQKARDQMVQAALGLIIMVAAYAIVGLVGSVIGFDILNPAGQIRTIFGVSGF